MYRNDRVVPTAALVVALVLFLATYLNGLNVEHLKGHPLEKFTAGQVGLVALGFVLLVFAVIGYVTVWLEGYELRPMHRRPHLSTFGFVAIIVATLAAMAVSGVFVQAMLHSARTEQNFPLYEGLLLGSAALLIAVVLSLYRRYFMDEVVKTESLDSEVPW